MNLEYRLKSSKACNISLKLANIFSNAFFFTPLVVVYWAATADIMYAHVFPDSANLLYMTTFIIANVVLIPVYLFQDEFQRYHDRLSIGTQIVDSTDTTGSNFKKSYYNKAFLFRFFYSYIVSFAYVAQWLSYWDAFSALLHDVHYLYFLLFTFVGIIAYRILLKSDLEWYCMVTPFILLRETQFDSYFIQWREITLTNVSYKDNTPFSKLNSLLTDN